MTGIASLISFWTAISSALFKASVRGMKRRGRFAALVTTIAFVVSLSGGVVLAQTSGMQNCIIASNDGRNGFRTDEITSCRVDTGTGNAIYTFKGDNRTRSYASVAPLTTLHLEAAAYWLNRVGSLQVPSGTNPAGFDPREFLQAASQATQGFVLTRNKRNGGQAVNVVYITDGVYRSIDFTGTDLREIPSGFLMTAP